MLHVSQWRRLFAAMLAVFCVSSMSVSAASAADPVLDLETLTGLQAEQMMQDGTLTSVQLVRAYINRIAAINKASAGINAVSQINPDALKEAALADQRRANGALLGPADGLPIIVKDLIDATPMYTSAGNFSLRNSFPPMDSGIIKKLRASGVVILGKYGLTEFANSFGNQHSGFSNLTGQVLNGIDTDAGPSGSSSGTGAGQAAALSMLGIGTETSGSIISPSQANGLVGLRPTIGLVPGYGIAPISASQDGAGPMERTVSNVALTMQSIAGPDPLADQEYIHIFGPDFHTSGVVPTPPAAVPNYMSALDLNFVQGKRIGYNCTLGAGTACQAAYDALVAGGAIMVSRPTIAVGSMPSLPAGYEQHKTIDEYYAGLGPLVPIHNLVEEIADNNANAHEALKFGNGNHTNAAAADITPGGANEVAYRTNLPLRKFEWHKAIDRMMTNDTADPSDDFIAILGSTPSSPQAGYPQITIPMAYSATTRRPGNISLNGGAYDERDLIGAAYVIEQATQLRKPAGQVNPSMYRCAKTVPAEPFASRGHCNPDYESLMAKVGTPPVIPFGLETESVQSLQARMTAGTLTAETLTKAYLARIAYTNAEGPALQAVRAVNSDAINEAIALDHERTTSGARGPLHGIPVLVDDSIDFHGMATSGGSIALQDSKPSADSTIVAKLKAAGAIILGKTNVSELNGIFSTSMTEGYSSLGGQALLPSDTDNNPGGSSAGSAAATASGLAAMTVGMETGTDLGAQLIAPAANNGVVALKPTVGLVGRTGTMPVAKSQDAFGPITRTVFDAATALQTMAGVDASDPSTTGQPAVPNYTAGLAAGQLNGQRVAAVGTLLPGTTAALTSVGATTVVKTAGTPSTTASIVGTEFKRDLNSYLGTGHTGGAHSLQEIIDYNNANPEEGLKFQQGELTTAQGVDLTDPAQNAPYLATATAVKAANGAVIDSIFDNGTPADTSDDFVTIVVPGGSSLIGIADKAGYPVLTMPAGFGTGSSGRNPVGLAFIGRPFGEEALLRYGYTYELQSNVRGALGTYAAGLPNPPSVTNPSMFRCVPYSTFYSPHHCNPGDQLATAPLSGPNGPTEFPISTEIGGTVTPFLEITLASATSSLGTFVPGASADYSTTLAASVTSTGGDATLSVKDPSTTAPGHLVNGAFSLVSPLQFRAYSGSPSGPFQPLGAATLSLLGYGAPVSKNAVTIEVKQHISDTEPLRTGNYAKTVLLTLSTLTP